MDQLASSDEAEEPGKFIELRRARLPKAGRIAGRVPEKEGSQGVATRLRWRLAVRVLLWTFLGRRGVQLCNLAVLKICPLIPSKSSILAQGQAARKARWFEALRLRRPGGKWRVSWRHKSENTACAGGDGRVAADEESEEESGPDFCAQPRGSREGQAVGGSVNGVDETCARLANQRAYRGLPDVNWFSLDCSAFATPRDDGFVRSGSSKARVSVYGQPTGASLEQRWRRIRPSGAVVSKCEERERVLLCSPG